MATKLKYPTSTNAVQKTLDAQLLSGATTSMTLNSVTGIQDKVGVCVIDAVDANGAATPAKREYILYTGISGSTLTGLTRNADGGSSDQDHAVGAIVQFGPDVLQQQAIIDSLLTEHNEDGTHKSATVTTLKATGAEINTGTEDAKIVTPKAIADSTIGKAPATASENVAGTDNAKFLTALANVPAFNNSLARQAIINGNFDVWQRGTSSTGVTPYYSGADRWQGFRAGAVAGGTWSRQDATAVAGSVYGLRAQRDSGNSATNALICAYAMETNDGKKLRGKKLTLSFWAKCGANFSPTSSILTAQIRNGTGTDISIAGGFTGDAVAGGSDVTLTTSYQKFTVTTTNVIAANITNIGVSFSATPTGTAGANDWYEITQVQLCAGDVALPFMPKSVSQEEYDCYKYAFFPLYGQTDKTIRARMVDYGANLFEIPIPIPRQFRGTGTPVLISGSEVTDWQIYNTSAVAQTGFALTVSSNSGGNAVNIIATKTSHGLTDAILMIKTSLFGFESEL